MPSHNNNKSVNIGPWSTRTYNIGAWSTRQTEIRVANLKR